jgi:CDP-diacylglycerol---serine O-phosphatidyltransferase
MMQEQHDISHEIIPHHAHDGVGVDEVGLPKRKPRLSRLMRFRRIPMRFVIPNLVTLLALCLGLTSIRFAIEADYYVAVLAIMGAAILDGIDGRIARALEGTSRFGAELDSLADFVDFGVAPAVLLYMWSLSEIKSLGWFAVLVFAVACALRLARFNVTNEDPDRPIWMAHFFQGMPAPAGAVVVLLPMYLHLSTGWPPQHNYVAFEIAYVLLVSFLMVSQIPHYSGKSIGRVPREYFIAVLLGSVALILFLAIFPMEVLIVLSLSYLALIPFSVMSHRRFMREQGVPTAAPSDMSGA